MVLISFLCLFTWENRLLRLNLCCFGKTKVEMLKFAAVMARCLTNNLRKFYQKILKYSENNELFVGGCFLAAPGSSSYHYSLPLMTASTVKLQHACALMVVRKPIEYIKSGECWHDRNPSKLAFIWDIAYWLVGYIVCEMSTSGPDMWNVAHVDISQTIK